MTSLTWAGEGGHLLSPLSLLLPLLLFPSIFLHHSSIYLTMSAPLTKVDSAIAGLSIDDKAPEPTEKEVLKDKKGHRRTSSTAAEGVWNINDLGK
jgi:hypothetical protein